MSIVNQSDSPQLAERLGGVCVGLREDLEVSRHVFRGAPAYIVRDPITFQNQRLEPNDYAILCRITSDMNLGATFDRLVEEGRLTRDDEHRFYEFILSLHTLGFLRLPLSDDRMLYKRYMVREQIKRRERLSSILFFRIPVWNPNAFLDRTIGMMRPLFSTGAFILWAMLLCSAVYIAVRNWSELVNPLQSVLAAENVFLMWLTLIGLKVFHEFGHAYACKHYGGHVPEMGIYLILFTPCAYVDATASWGFSKKRHRLFVSLAGMYIEIALACLAVFVWALTEPSLIHSVAHNAIFLASAVTVLFNINPLMRYDGYYILCDLLEIPNLRAKSSECLATQIKSRLLGVPRRDTSMDKKTTVTLCCFGVAGAIYRAFLMVAITAILASKFFVIGLAFGVFVLGKTILSLILRLTRYLWYSDETTGRRWRAVAVSVVCLLLIPAGVMWIPVQANVYAAGIATRETEVVVRTSTPGFVTEVLVKPGQTLHRNSVIARLESHTAQEALSESESQMRASALRRDAYRTVDPHKLEEEKAAVQGIVAAYDLARNRADALSIVAPVEGIAVQSITDDFTGRFLNEGDPVATIEAGAWHVRTVLTAEELTSSNPTIGTPVSFRAVNQSDLILDGRITRIIPSGSHTISMEALTHLAGRGIAVDPATHRAGEAYFELTAVLTNIQRDVLRPGLTGELRLAGKREPLGVAVLRRVIGFWNKLRRD